MQMDKKGDYIDILVSFIGNNRNTYAFAEVFRRESYIFFEESAEIELIFEIQIEGYFFDRLMSEVQLLFGF